MHTAPPHTWSSTRSSKWSLFFSSPRFLGASQLRTPQGRRNRACLVRWFEQLFGQEDISHRRIVIIINTLNESYCVCCSRSPRSSLSFVLPDRIRAGTGIICTSETQRPSVTFDQDHAHTAVSLFFPRNYWTGLMRHTTARPTALRSFVSL